MITFDIPTSGPITTRPTITHDAYHIACEYGEPVKAVHQGGVTYYWSDKLGWVVLLEQEGRVTRYSNLGVFVPRSHAIEGDVIGLCGNSSPYSDKTFLQFESFSDEPFRF